MKRSDMRVSQARWRALGSAALAAVAIAVIGSTTVAPARADYDDWRQHNEWREHREREEWREHRERREDHPRAGVYFNFGTPQPGYYEYDRY